METKEHWISLAQSHLKPGFDIEKFVRHIQADAYK